MAVLAAAPSGFLWAQSERAPERVVTSVRFRNNRALPDDTLAAAISTSPSNWSLLRGLGLGQRRLFDETEFRRDVVRLSLLYRRHGYYDARIDTAVERGEATAAVTFRIDEGPPVLVDSVAVWGGDSVVGARRLRERIGLQEGRPFDRARFEASADSILEAIRNRGYPFAQVYKSYVVDRAVRTAAVEFLVEPGPRARVGEILILGNRSVTARTVRRSLAVSPGDWFSREALFASQKSLYQTDLFRLVTVDVARDSLVGGSDTLVRLAVQLTEGGRTRLRNSVGYGTIDCFRVQSSLGAGNFLGGARRLEAAFKLSKLGFGHPTATGARDALCPALSEDDRFSDTLNYLASLTLTQPALFARRNALTLSAFAERRSEFKVFERVAVGASFSVGFGVGRDIPVSFSYRVANGRTRADIGTFCVYFDRCERDAVSLLSEPHRQATLGVQVLESHTDSPLDPTRGHSISVDATVAAREIGSEFVYRKLVGEVALYRRLRRGLVLALRARAGVVRPGVTVLGDSTISYVPPEERFYAGGPTTVRGFGRNEMGPVVYVADSLRDGTGEPAGLRTSPIGSSAVALANAELRLPSPVLPSRLRLALFVDASRLWDEGPEGLIPTRVYVTPGVGLRIATPLGPMRLDAAYNAYPSQRGRLYVVSGAELDLAREDYSGPRRSPLQLHFSVGQPF